MVCSATALCKSLNGFPNFGQPLRETAGGTTKGHAEGETLATSGSYRRPVFKSGLKGRPRRAIVQKLQQLRTESSTIRTGFLHVKSLVGPSRNRQCRNP